MKQNPIKKSAVCFTLRELVGFRYGKKHFLKIVTGLVTVLLKMKLCLFIYFVFTKNPLF